MKHLSALFILILMFSMLVNIFSFTNVNAQPRSDLEIIWYSDFSICYSALKNHDVDIMGYELTYDLFEDAQTDPNIQLASYDENGILEFDINNNYSIPSYPNIRSPTNELKVRQAIAHLINKSYIVKEILPSFWGNIIDVPISNCLQGWWNPNVTGDNYPYSYDPDTAAALLASLGFNDTDGNGYLNYPSDWPGIENLPSTDTTSMPLIFYIREDIEDRRAVGEYLIFQLEGDRSIPGDSPLATANWPDGFRGGDVTKGDPQFISFEVMQRRNYHIYTGAWMLSRFPAAYMYYLFHSDNWYPWGSNYVTGMNREGLPNYPDLDEELREAYYAQNLSSAVFHCKNAQYLLVEKYCVSIWLWNYRAFNAYRKEVVAVVSQQALGLDNDYTYLNTYRADSPELPVRLGVSPPSSSPSIPEKLNPLYSCWVYEWQMLDKVYTYLRSVNPYSLEIDQPWAVQDWEVGTWFDPREQTTKTKITLWLRKNIGCAEPQTGNFVDYFTADDFEFSVWYIYAYNDSWSWSSVMDINHVKIVNDYQVEVYFDTYSLWATYSLDSMPLLGPKYLLIDKLCEPANATFTGADLTEVAPGYFEYQFTTDNVVDVINVTVNGVSINENEDFYIRAGYDAQQHNIFVNLTSFAPTDTITIYYYRAIPNGADGFYLGGNLGLDWTDTMYSYGLYYPISINPVAGGKAVLKKNPYFFLETPPLGEIDWRWYWEGSETKPRSGYYRIDILDVVLCTGSYCQRGDGEYNPLYFPGADLDANDLCHVGILDLVSTTGNYFTKFGIPPPSS